MNKHIESLLQLQLRQLETIARQIRTTLMFLGNPTLQNNPETLKVFDKCLEVFQSLHWLTVKNSALDELTPLEKLTQPEGAEQVMTLLIRIEHGVLS